MVGQINWQEASAEACFAEAEARIAHARETGSGSLDLSGLRRLAALLAEIGRLAHLKNLNICKTAIGDLSALITLIALQSL